MITKIIPEEKIIQAHKAIDRAERIVIISHIGPDGDALGSALGLYHFLFSLDKETRIIMPNAFPAFLNFLPSSSDVLIYEDYQDESEDLVASADIIFCLDFNQLKRIGKLGELVEKAKGIKIMLDHHPLPDAFANISISHPEIASTSELVFRLICRMGYFSEITKQCAECICCGIITDTGGLSYNSNSPEIYTIVAELIKKGVDKDAMYRHLYSNYSADRMRLMGYVLSEKMKIYSEYQTAIISLTKKEQTKFQPQKGDTEGFVNLPLSITDIMFSVFLKEEDDQIKISFRSQGDFPTNKFASELFSGGGHLNASGAESKLSLEETVSKIENALPAYYQEWNEFLNTKE